MVELDDAFIGMHSRHLASGPGESEANRKRSVEVAQETRTDPKMSALTDGRCTLCEEAEVNG